MLKINILLRAVLVIVALFNHLIAMKQFGFVSQESFSSGGLTTTNSPISSICASGLSYFGGRSPAAKSSREFGDSSPAPKRPRLTVANLAANDSIYGDPKNSYCCFWDRDDSELSSMKVLWDHSYKGAIANSIEPDIKGWLSNNDSTAPETIKRECDASENRYVGSHGRHMLMQYRGEIKPLCDFLYTGTPAAQILKRDFLRFLCTDVFEEQGYCVGNTSPLISSRKSVEKSKKLVLETQRYVKILFELFTYFGGAGKVRSISQEFDKALQVDEVDEILNKIQGVSLMAQKMSASLRWCGVCDIGCRAPEFDMRAMYRLLARYFDAFSVVSDCTDDVCGVPCSDAVLELFDSLKLNLSVRGGAELMLCRDTEAFYTKLFDYYRRR